MTKKTKYDDWKRDALIATLLDRDEEIQKLKQRTADDYIRELIQDATGGRY